MSRVAQGARVVAVVPLYEPASSTAASIRAAAAQVDGVVLVDDGSSTDPQGFVEDLGLPSVRLLVLQQNSGIAHALNRGIEIALEEFDAGLILTIDQDSVLDPDYVDQARSAIAALEAAGVPFAATAVGTVNGKLERGTGLVELPLLSTRETIQSGLLFPAEVLRALGDFDESFFIDCVDTDYILRAAGRGLQTVVVPNCRMSHAIGEGIPVRLPLLSRRREYSVPYHRPERRYYITRNRLRLLARHGSRMPRWAVRQTYEQLKYLGLDLVWGPAKGLQVLAVVVGVLDALRRRSGRLQPRLRSVLRGDARIDRGADALSR